MSTGNPPAGLPGSTTPAPVIGSGLGNGVAAEGEFLFEGVEWDGDARIATFSYRFTEPVDRRFTETIAFAPGSAVGPEDAEAFERVLVFLGAVLGISYYKAAVPPRYTIVPEGLTGAALAFLRSAVPLGLAEFAYRAGRAGLVTPTIATLGGVAADAASRAMADARLRAPLVPVGGGKDSVVSVALLGGAGLDVTQVAVNPNSIIERVMAGADAPAVSVRRRIDPALLDWNANGALNGHVPVTAMNILICVAQSLLLGAGPVVMSNEASASEATLDWHGTAVNHQWSKSIEAEIALGHALAAQTGYADLSFSLLRPFSELGIARLFGATSGFEHLIVSCNRAYRMSGAAPSWCGDCDKCRFVFLAFAATLGLERTVAIVGRDLFDDGSQVAGYEALLGLGLHKPFECVGEIRESQVAMSLALRDPVLRDSVVGRTLLAAAPWLDQATERYGEAVLGIQPGAPAVPAPYEAVRRAVA
jgi:UDP-N-acetyl-alpha-D-muramoyl-L-alanyl-L-glutamate epimerase